MYLAPMLAIRQAADSKTQTWSGLSDEVPCGSQSVQATNGIQNVHTPTLLQVVPIYYSLISLSKKCGTAHIDISF